MTGSHLWGQPIKILVASALLSWVTCSREDQLPCPEDTQTVAWRKAQLARKLRSLPINSKNWHVRHPGWATLEAEPPVPDKPSNTSNCSQHPYYKLMRNRCWDVITQLAIGFLPKRITHAYFLKYFFNISQFSFLLIKTLGISKLKCTDVMILQYIAIVNIYKIAYCEFERLKNKIYIKWQNI